MATATPSSALLPFEGDGRLIRRQWHEGQWYFSVIDVVELLTDSAELRYYWADMKRRIQDEGFVELLAKCQRLKMRAIDGKQRLEAERQPPLVQADEGDTAK